MGSEIGAVPEAAALSGEPRAAAEGEKRSPDCSIGAYLARERRLRGISLPELAELTKIPQRSLERMEAGAFDGNPDGFVRGFVRTVSAGLGLNPEEAVMRMLGEPADLGEHASPRGVRLERWQLAAAGLLVVLLGLGFAIWAWQARAPSTPSAAAADPASEIVYRRDAVRALAAEQSRSERAAERDADALEPVGSPGGQHPD